MRGLQQPRDLVQLALQVRHLRLQRGVLLVQPLHVAVRGRGLGLALALLQLIAQDVHGLSAGVVAAPLPRRKPRDVLVADLLYAGVGPVRQAQKGSARGKDGLGRAGRRALVRRGGGARARPQEALVGDDAPEDVRLELERQRVAHPDDVLVNHVLQDVARRGPGRHDILERMGISGVSS